MKQLTAAPSLRELQLWMKWIVTDPRGVTEALAEPFPSDRPDIERYTSPQKTALPWILESPGKSKASRIDIYAEAYFIRVFESMKLDFPITAQILGDLSFRKLVADYLKKYPSRTFTIGEIGKSFSKFVAGYDDLTHIECLQDIIHLEWLAIESFFAKNTGFIEVSKLAILSDDDWEKTSFIIADSVRIIESHWPLEKIWRIKKEDLGADLLFEKLKMAQHFLLVREQGTVQVERIQNSEFEILRSLKSGASLIAALKNAQKKLIDQGIESELTNWFNEWTRRGVICDLNTNIEKVDL